MLGRLEARELVAADFAAVFAALAARCVRRATRLGGQSCQAWPR